MSLYIACESMDLLWTLSDVHVVDQLWRKGDSIESIAKNVSRDVDEVAILVVDRVRQNKLHNRPGGVFGGPKETPKPRGKKPLDIEQRPIDELTPESYLRDRDNGMTKYAIQKKYGIQHTSLQWRLKKWNLLDR